MNSYSLKNLTERQKENRRRIIQISFERYLSHIGSCLNSIDIIDIIYQIKKKNDTFILSNGHAGIAWYVVLERYGLLNDAKIKKLNIHPDRNLLHGINVSTGSLGHGLPIAIGLAIADKKNIVYCMISDGECAEGSIWESLKIIQAQNVNNLKIIVTANKWGAYDSINLKILKNQLRGFGFKVIVLNGHNEKNIRTELIKNYSKPIIFFAKTFSDQFSFLKGQDAHYYTLTENDFNYALKKLL